jgi:hypothetical protein
VSLECHVFIYSSTNANFTQNPKTGGGDRGSGSSSPWGGTWGGYGYGDGEPGGGRGGDRGGSGGDRGGRGGDRGGRGGRGGDDDDDDDDERKGRVLAVRQVAGAAPIAPVAPPKPVTARLIATWKAPKGVSRIPVNRRIRRQAPTAPSFNTTSIQNVTAPAEGGCCANAVWYD